MKLKVPGVPPGQYEGGFSGLEKTVHQGFGDGLAWQFEIDRGAFSGQTASRVTGDKPTANNACGAMLQCVTGQRPVVGEEFDIDAFVGRRYAIVVEAGKNGGSRVASAVLLQEKQNDKDSGEAPF